MTDPIPDTLTLRAATPADAADAAPLILAAGRALFGRLFGPRPEDAARFFEDLFARPANPFSYDFAVAAEREGRVVGLALAAPVGARRRVQGRMLWLLPRLAGLRVLWRLLPAVWDLRGTTSPPPPGSFYLSILSVAPDAQGQGIGGRLLDDAARRARLAGCRSICLHAEIDNAGARRFYERHGYRVTAEHPSPRAARWGVAGFASMQREVGP